MPTLVFSHINDQTVPASGNADWDSHFILFPGLKPVLESRLFFIQYTGVQCQNIHVCAWMPQQFSLHSHNQFTLKKNPRNLETEVDIRKKQSGFYSFCVNLLRPAESYLGIISINTWRKVSVSNKVQTNKRKRNWQGKSNSFLQKSHRAKSKKSES